MGSKNIIPENCASPRIPAASYTDPLTKLVHWEAANLVKKRIVVLKYSGPFLQVLQFVLNSQFAYYMLEVTITEGIMFINIRHEIPHEDRI